MQKGQDDFRQFHDLVKMGIQHSKPKCHIPKPELTQTQAKEAVALRRKYIDQLTKQDSEYKELSQEIYFLLISNASEGDEGIQEDKLKVIIMGKIISCRASDIVWNELGFDEQQIEEGIEKWKLEDNKPKDGVEGGAGEAQEAKKEEKSNKRNEDMIFD